jgi:hypothetical protein
MADNDTDPGDWITPKETNSDVEPGDWVSPPTTAADYENVPLLEAASKGISNLPTSALRALTAIPSIIYHAPEIESQLGEVRQMPYVAPKSMAQGQPLTPSALAKQWITPEESGIGTPMTEEEEQTRQAARNELAKQLIESFTPAGLKKTLAEDPFSILTLLSAPLSGGASLLGETTFAGKALNTLSYATDPLKSAMGTAKIISQAVPSGLQKGVSLTANVPTTSLEKAFEAGASVNPTIKDAFNTYAKGNGDPVSFSRIVSNAAESLKAKAYQGWKNSKEALSGAATQDIDPAPIRAAIDAERAKLPPRDLSLDTAPHDALDYFEGKLNSRLASPSGSPDRTLTGFDQLKQELYSFGKSQSNPQSYNAMMGVHAGIKNALNNTAPEYQRLMENYQELLSNLKNINQTVGNTPRGSANSTIAKTIRAQKTFQGQDVLEQLAHEDSRIPYMVAGATLHDAAPSGLARGLEGSGIALNAVGALHALLSGDFTRAGIHLSGLAIQPVIQSPSVMGKTMYGAGSIASSFPAQAVKGAASTAKAAEPYVEPIAANINRIENPPQQSTGGRLPRKSGGKVQTGHQHLVDRLFRLAETSKKAEKDRTKPLLNVPDEAVAHALEIAQKAI